MPSVKVFTSLILVIITILIVTVLLTRISKPVEVEAVGGVYDAFFGTSNTLPDRLLTLEAGKLLLHCERARGWEVRLATPQGEVRCMNTNAQRITLPPTGLGLYTLTLQKGEDRLVQTYAVRTERFTHTLLGGNVRTVLRILQHDEEFFEDCQGAQPLRWDVLIDNPPLCVELQEREGVARPRREMLAPIYTFLSIGSFSECSACIKAGECAEDVQAFLFWLNHKILSDKKVLFFLFTQLPRLPPERQEALKRAYMTQAQRFTLEEEGVTCPEKIARLA